MAAQLECTPAMVRAQFELNARQLAHMAELARKTGRKVNGHTAEKLAMMAASALARSQE